MIHHEMVKTLWYTGTNCRQNQRNDFKDHKTPGYRR